MSRKDFQTPVGRGETARASGEEVGKIEGRMGVYDFTSKHKNTHAAALDPAGSASGSALDSQKHRGSSTDRKRACKQDEVVHWEHTLCRLKHTEASDSCNVGECTYITSAAVQEPSCQRPPWGRTTGSTWQQVSPSAHVSPQSCLFLERLKGTIHWKIM